MLSTAPCTYCGGIGYLRESPIAHDVFCYKCVDCQKSFVTQEVVTHNISVMNKEPLEFEVLYERPDMDTTRPGPMASGWGGLPIPYHYELQGIEVKGDYLMFLVEGHGV